MILARVVGPRVVVGFFDDGERFLDPNILSATEAYNSHYGTGTVQHKTQATLSSSLISGTGSVSRRFYKIPGSSKIYAFRPVNTGEVTLLLEVLGFQILTRVTLLRRLVTL